MAYFIGINKKERYAYSFDDIALAPGNITIDTKEMHWYIK